MITAGKLDHMISLRQPTNTVDAAGGPAQSWSLAGKVWAHLRVSSGGERDTGNRLIGRRTLSFIARASGTGASVRTGWQVVSGGITYEVIAVYPYAAEPRGTYIEIVVEGGSD